MKGKKVLCPCESPNGKTRWRNVGRAYENKDGSTNVYLDAYPANGKLQIRDWEEDEEYRSKWRGRDGGGAAAAADEGQGEMPF